MKIIDLKTFVVGNPPPHFGGRFFVFVKLTTDTGITGIGEVYAVPFHPHVVEKMIADVFGRVVHNSDPFRIETLFRTVYSSGFTQRPDMSLAGIVSGLEMACWDIIGKACDKPVYELLGGKVHDRLRTYTYLYPQPGDKTDVYMDADLAAERAVYYADMGFTAVKFDPLSFYSAFDPRQPTLAGLERCVQFVQKIREAVGTRCDLLFGTHGQLTPTGAIRLAKQLEPYDPLWLEEPVPPDNVNAMAQVAHQTSIPVATGERLATKYEFAQLLRHDAAAILQLNLGRVGGILEGKKIAGMAEAFHAQIAPHCYNGPIGGMANAQLSACSPNFLILESIQTWGGFHDDLVEQKIRWENGFVIPPATPGLGITLNEAVANAHPYMGDKLHLEMWARPVVPNDGTDPTNINQTGSA